MVRELVMVDRVRTSAPVGGILEDDEAVIGVDAGFQSAVSVLVRWAGVSSLRLLVLRGVFVQSPNGSS